MKRLSLCIWTLLFLQLPFCAQAATEVIQVNFIALHEAKAAAQTQLSPQGKVVTMPSQRQLIVVDDNAAVERVRQLLRRIDAMAPQYLVRVEISSQRQMQRQGFGVEAVLPGGWVRIQAHDSRQQSYSPQSYNLRIQGGKIGSIKAGQIIPVRQRVRTWLTGMGMVIEQKNELIPVTSGFDVHIQAAGESYVMVSIHPWLKQLKTQRGDDAALRIDIAEAVTELTVPLGQTVVLAGTSGAAKQLASALIAAGKDTSEQQLQFQLRVDTTR